MAPFMTFEHSEAGTKTCNLVWSVRTMELISSMARIRHVGVPIIHTRDLSVHTVAPIGRLFFVKPMEVLARERSQNFLNSFEYTIFPQHPEVGIY